jgi:hypothetical protein
MHINKRWKKYGRNMERSGIIGIENIKLKREI